MTFPSINSDSTTSSTSSAGLRPDADRLPEDFRTLVDDYTRLINMLSSTDRKSWPEPLRQHLLRRLRHQRQALQASPEAAQQ